MAYFDGSLKDFVKYFGPYCRNTVQALSRKYKSAKGKCEYCHVSEKLQAAHINGRERPVIISEIVTQFMSGDKLTISLSEFESLFELAHTPIEKVILILCNDCHLRYDRKNRIKDSSEQADGFENNSEVEEAELVTKLVKAQQLKKPLALEIVSRRYNAALTDKNCIYSNINRQTDEWWLQPKISRFQSDLHIVLNDSITNKLYYFLLPKGCVSNPSTVFNKRSDKPYLHILIPVSTTDFIEKSGFSFTDFFVGEAEY